MTAIRHVVGFYWRSQRRWYRAAVCSTGREASEEMNHMMAVLRHTGDAEPRVRIRMGDPAELMKTMNGGRL